MTNTQFYTVTVNPLDATQFYGGTQDNGTVRSPGGIDEWWMIRGGDGFYVNVDYADTSVIYAETQWGGLKRSDNSGYIFSNKMNGIDYQNERHNWNTPVVMDPTHHTILYYGSNRLYKTEDRAENWFPISGDLTNGPGPGNYTFGTITTIAAAATDSQVVYVGTDDANVWVTQNAGGTWTNVSSTLPDRWVTRVAVDPYDAGIAYATFSGYRESSWTPHIYRTTDYGANWDDVHGDLSDAPINDVIVDPDADSTLYIATDFGVYFTTNLGQTWAPLGTGMPIVPVHDIVLHPGGRRLGAGTHGRSIFVTSVDCGTTVPCNCICPRQGDFDEDGFLTSVDVASLIDIVFFNGSDITDPVCSSTRGDFNCDSFADSVDLSLLIDHVFFGGVGPCDPCGP